MKFKKALTILVLCIALLSLAASAYGVFSNSGPGQHEFKSLHGQTVEIYGIGLYQNDSVSMAAQARAQDVVTLFLGIPLLVLSLYLFQKGLIKGKLLLTGTLGYFLYTYTSYSFIGMYNPLFLNYVALMSICFFAFILSILSFDLKNLNSHFSDRLPVRFIGGFMIFIAVMVALMWLSLIVQPLISGTTPTVLEHYTTLVIQALDLGIVIPAAILSGILLIKRKPFGYLLAPILIIKDITMLTALTAMIIGQLVSGVNVGLIAMIAFPLFNLIMFYPLILIMRNIKESRHDIRRAS